MPQFFTAYSFVWNRAFKKPLVNFCLENEGSGLLPAITLMDTPRLWTKNFTIITFGSAISILGNAISEFAISLLVLDKTDDIFLYALFLAAINLPKAILPLIAGPYLDKYSRRKSVYTLDFISAGIFVLFFLITQSGYFNYSLYLALAILIGCIDSVYIVAYDSFFPMLVSEGNFSKAYSISSLLYPLAVAMTPVAALIYKHFGLSPLFLFNAFSFIFAAVCEMQIKIDESHVKKDGEPFSLSVFKNEFKDGYSYIKSEKGLLIITVYFFINTLTAFGVNTLWIPYFKSVPSLDVMAYSYVAAINVGGRLVGGGVQYKLRYPPKKKFAIALVVYIAVSVIDGGVLFTPFAVMLALFFLDGLLSATSFNIRVSTTQSYVPEEYRGRFNGCFQMFCNTGIIIGVLLAGASAKFFSCRAIIVGLMVLNIIGTFAVMYRGRRFVKPIYNRDV